MRILFFHITNYSIQIFAFLVAFFHLLCIPTDSTFEIFNPSATEVYMRMAKEKLFSSQFIRELSAEFISTAFLLALGIGSGCAKTFSNGAGGNMTTVVLGWGLAVAFGVTISGGISGGHLNPAVTFAFALGGDFPFYKFPFYVIAQLFGAFLGSALVFGVYYDAFNAFNNGIRVIEGVNGTAGLFATYPQPTVSTSGALLNEIFATCILLICVMAIIDDRNLAIPKYLLPLMVGLVIVLINCSLCYNSGCAMNPARDLGPRLFTFVAGWGVDVFSFRNWNWFWVPIIGPMIGGPVGLYVYKLSIDFFWMHREFEGSENGGEMIIRTPHCTCKEEMYLKDKPGTVQCANV